MWKKTTGLILVMIMLFVSWAPLASAKKEKDPMSEVYGIDRKILGVQKTLNFLQSLAQKKGDHQLAKKIEKQAAFYFQKNKQLHEGFGRIGKKKKKNEDQQNLLDYGKKFKDLQAEYQQYSATYWNELQPAPKTSSTLLLRSTLAVDSSVWDSFEPNDDFPDSYPITSGNLYVSKLSTNTDMDMYRFDSGSMVGTLTVTLNVPTDKDYDFIVMQGTDMVIDFGMEEQPGKKEEVSFQVEPNTSYHIVVLSYKGEFSTTSTYTLGFSKVVPILDVASPIDISLPAGEIPAYRFTAPVSGNYRFFTSPYGGFGAPNDTMIVLYADEQMQELIDANDDAEEGSLFSEVNVVLTKGVTYFVYVSPYKQDHDLHARLTAVLDAKANLTSPVLHESAINDGSIKDEQVIQLEHGEFTSDVANGVRVNHLPEGLTFNVTRNSETQITILFTGNALWHENKHDVMDATVTISKDKIIGAGADVATATFTFDFLDTEELKVDTPQDVNLNVGQNRIFKFTAPMTGDYEVFTTYYGADQSQLSSNTVLALFEDYSQTRRLAYNDDGITPPFSSLLASLKSGQDYYVVLSSANGGSVHARLGVRYLGVEYIYNQRGQLVLIKQGGNILTEFFYDGNGNLIKRVGQ
ncbi:hypothetical protein T458_07735 [Brevibacillus panacihumi W25]|uniref:Uncharacterized protein n=1 Tax=Brevibacillus panacihumi W25 TaxID=1408254 RepID=V6MBV8_9BACL|nr:hypothetical protein [Brevibacillus panacihumi]EST55722.1 hypothetical protein T458_07735 [Brevibacillus panacihumi W25]